jgi:uncharacterized protein
LQTTRRGRGVSLVAAQNGLSGDPSQQAAAYGQPGGISIGASVRINGAGWGGPHAVVYHRDMLRLSEIKLPLDHTALQLHERLCSLLSVAPADITRFTVFKRSFDARQAHLSVVYIVDVALCSLDLETQVLTQLGKHPHIKASPDMAYQPPYRANGNEADRPVVVGFGPCGIFAALVLAQMGFRPIVIERGTAVRQRTKDTWDLWRKRVFHAESNVQFGEGGAGTFSDGKLYSQIKDPRFLGRKVMQEFVKAGAPADILVEAHPHIGTFKLVKVVESLRQQIIALGGEIRFEQRVTGLHLEPDPNHKGTQRLTGLTVLDRGTGKSYDLATRYAVLALGHSARDTFEMLHDCGVYMVAKPFSVGFRIEHPQGMIDRARWGRHAGHPSLGAAEYRLVHHASNGRTVYSFCMCPGGTVVAATSEPERVVTNGMSQYSRNERNANAGIVVGITPADYPGPRMKNGHVNPLAGMQLQRTLESHAYVLGGKTYDAPAQLVGDFLADTSSEHLGAVVPSYKPGIRLTNLASALPDYAIVALREALPAFAKKVDGFDRADALLTGVETRTSSPLCIERGDDFQSVNTRGLFPGGEGAGYAGGILSAGVDGIKLAEAVARALQA